MISCSKDINFKISITLVNELSAKDRKFRDIV